MKNIFLIIIQLFIYKYISGQGTTVWKWECINNKYCQKRLIDSEVNDTAVSLGVCQLLCSDNANLWPLPTGKIYIGKDLLTVNPNSIDVIGLKSDSRMFEIIKKAGKHFKNQIINLIPNKSHTNGGLTLLVTLKVSNESVQYLTLDTDESYNLNIVKSPDGRINVTINAATYFGGRHGLETLSQLVTFDDVQHRLIIPNNVYIEDGPVYPYRGILLDTSRNFISVEAIKRIIDGMGASKLNRFHWHISDSHSFPYFSKSHPELSHYGAYSQRQIYDEKAIRDVLDFALVRGVSVVPEFDAPAHVGEGWQKTDFVVCFNKRPWQNYCVEPPCGQLDPTKEKLYDYIEGIYGDMLDQFKPDIFHMGGDEVQFKCWNSTESIVDWMYNQSWSRSEKDFIKLWDRFQKEAAERLYKKAGKKLPIILWTSTLTKMPFVTKFLPKDEYIIQIWTTGDDIQVKDLLQNGYNIILSNYDALYFDCGFSGWVQGGNNWCSPYVGWQRVYENSPSRIAGVYKNQVLGSEATLWTEQVDSFTVDGRLWPRASAMAEVVWSEPQTTNWRDAETRFLIHRERLTNLGIAAEAIEPQWCRQYEEHCPIDGKLNY